LRAKILKADISQTNQSTGILKHHCNNIWQKYIGIGSYKANAS
jgi:hypothetical protein